MIIASKINKNIVDLHTISTQEDQEKKFIYRDSIDGEEILRHSAAHVLGEVINTQYKNVSCGIGPITEYGFYYDILMDETISVHQLEKLENLMKESIRKKYPFHKQYIDKKDAYELFKNNICKKLILDNINEEKISLYTHNNFIDLCEGPHVINTHIIGEHFKLLKVSQITWKDMLLQRVEGILFYSKERLDNHIMYLHKQNSIDHRKIGEECDLFRQINVSQGNIFWLKNGTILFHTICNYLQEKYQQYNYQVVKTPLLFQNQLWKITGHLDKYQDNMYITTENHIIKPMNCPAHVEIFKTFNNSYKDLPIRIGEIAHVHRKEETGGLNGLKRACGFHQDDGHIFCTLEHILPEIQSFMCMLQEIYTDFGFLDYEIILSTKPKNSIGSAEKWENSENILKEWLISNEYKHQIIEGDGAFYGPKIEIQLKDNFSRQWTCGTLQWDDFLPERLEAYFNNQNNEKQNPIMLHRAVLGSIERFIAILLEHYEGHLPLWLTPIVIMIICVSEKCYTYAQTIHDYIYNNQIKVNLDIQNTTLNSKLKKYLIKKIPFIIIIGEEEILHKYITIRYKNKNRTMQLEHFVIIIKQIITGKYKDNTIYEQI
jgi:threonyl-tRNA synthetase